MSADLTPLETAKFVAAKQAAEYIEDGMRIGLGSGTTSEWFVQCLGEVVREQGLNVQIVPTSRRTAILARKLDLEVVDLANTKWLDLTVDGADEYTAELNLIKGGGGALLREKILATVSERVIMIADASKKVDTLGAFPLPVEVAPFAQKITEGLIAETLSSLDVLGSEITQRMNGDRPFVTDQGNHILDLHLKRIANPRQLAFMLNQVPGVMENGLFVDIFDVAIIGHADGRVTTRDLSSNSASVVRYEVLDDFNIFVDAGD